MKVGSKVRLNSGGPLMTVTHIEDGKAKCQWMAKVHNWGVSIGEAEFPIASLTPLEVDEPQSVYVTAKQEIQNLTDERDHLIETTHRQREKVENLRVKLSAVVNELAREKELTRQLSDRCHQQSEKLGKKAEKPSVGSGTVTGVIVTGGSVLSGDGHFIIDRNAAILDKAEDAMNRTIDLLKLINEKLATKPAT